MAEQPGDEQEGEGNYRCPCGGRFSIALKHGQPNGVIHTMPICAKFSELPVEEFLAWINQRARS